MKSVEYDLRYLEAGLEELEGYLLSGDIFWPLGARPPAGEPDYPQLTLDWLLLSRARVDGRQLSGDQKARAEKAISDLDIFRTKWRVAWEKKAGQCFQARARMWSDYLSEYRENPQDNADRYPYEVRLRAMLELSRSEYRQPNADAEFLSGVDGLLRSLLVPGEFIWEPEVQAGFPRERFWFLYGNLPAKASKP